MAQNSTPLYPVLQKLCHKQHALAKEHFSVKLTQLLHQQADLLRLLAENSKSGQILNGEKWIPVSLLNSDNSRRIPYSSMKPRIESAFDELLDVLYKTQMTRDLKEIDSLNQELNSLDQLDESTNQNDLLRMRERVDSGFESQNDAQSVDYYETTPSPSDSILSGWRYDDKEEIYSPDDCVNSFPSNVEIKIENQNVSILEHENQSPTLPAVQTNTSVCSSVQNFLPVIPQTPPPVPSPLKSTNPKINVVHIKTVEQAQKLFKALPALANQLQMAQPLPSLGGRDFGGFVLAPNGTDGSFTCSNIISLTKSSTQNLDSNSVSNSSVPQTVPALETKVSDSNGSKSSGANGSYGSVQIYVPPNSTPRIMLPKNTNGLQNASKNIVSPTSSSVPIGSHPVTSPAKTKPSISTKSILAIFQCDLCKAVFMNYGQCNKHVGDYHFTVSNRPTGYPQDYVKILDATSIAPSSVSSSTSTVSQANEPSLPEITKSLLKQYPKESSSMKQSLNSIYKRLNLNPKNSPKPKEPQSNETNYQKMVKKLRVSAFPDGDLCPIMHEEEKDETETVEVNTGNRSSTINQQRPLVQMMAEMAKARRNHQNGVMNVILPNVDTTRVNVQVKRKGAD